MLLANEAYNYGRIFRRRSGSNEKESHLLCLSEGICDGQPHLETKASDPGLFWRRKRDGVVGRQGNLPHPVDLGLEGLM